MNNKNTISRLALSLLVCLFSLAASAQKIALTFNNVSLSEALKQIAQAQSQNHVHFVFDELEDFRVTKTISSESAYDAVREVCGFYPMLISMKGKDIFVECAQKDAAKLIGRVVDEKGGPLEFANVSLYSTTENSLITGGITNADGNFVIPCEQNAFIARVSYVGYETLVRTLEFPKNAASLDVGTLSLKVDPKVISEVKVVGDIATTSAEKSTYFPSSRHRNAATDAISLLHHMMIPQLRLNPLTGYVTTLSGASVSIFIDYIPATDDDLAGMNTQDVKRVEILDFPSDVRFKGYPHVINFVMHKYETGGYTKATSTEMILADFTSTNSVYSKLSHKKWTFDANINGRFSNKYHMGMEKVETFNLPTQTITRTETAHDGKLRTERNSASFRATYNSEKMQLANRLEFLDQNTPKKDLSGNVSYNPNLISSTTFASRQASRSLTPTYKGDWNFFMPKNWQLSVSPEFRYSHNEQNRFYQETSTIQNDIKENSSHLLWEIQLGKTFAKKHTVSLGNYGIYYNSRMDYRGSTNAHQEVNFIALSVPLSYNFQTEKVNLATQFVPTYQRNKVNGENVTQWCPMGDLEITYAFNHKHSLEAGFGINLTAADGSIRNPSVIQESELMLYCGNPQLKNFNNYYFSLQYNLMPSNTFTASAFIQHFYNHDYYATVWELHNDGLSILRRYDNVGNAHFTDIGANLTLRLLDGNLQLNAVPQLSLTNIKGLYDEHEARFSLDCSAACYVGQFNFRLGYTLPNQNYKREGHQWQRNRSYYYLTAGWGNKHWKAKLDIVNLFRTDWRDTRTIISTPIYSQVSNTFNSSSHQRLNLTLTYIFNYGKKVKAGNELGTASGGQSSIL